MTINPKLETALWMIGGGAAGAVGEYLRGHIPGQPLNFGAMEQAAALGAFTALAALFRTPPGSATTSTTTLTETTKVVPGDEAKATDVPTMEVKG